MKNKFPLCYGGKVNKDLDGGKFLDKMYISMTFSVLKPIYVKWMIELYNLITSPVGWPVKGWKVTVITEAAVTNTSQKMKLFAKYSIQ